MNHLRLEGPDLIWYNTLHFGHDVLASSDSIKQQIDTGLNNCYNSNKTGHPRPQQNNSENIE
jgi:hypothetical protein